jgi:hypothetical protein
VLPGQRGLRQFEHVGVEGDECDGSHGVPGGRDRMKRDETVYDENVSTRRDNRLTP